MKKLVYLSLLFWLTIHDLSGQTMIMDSLRNLLWALPNDTTKVMTSLRYGQRLFSHQPDLGLAVINDASCLADSLYFNKGQFHSRSLLFDYYQKIGQWELAWEQAQVVFDWAQKHERDFYKQNAYLKLGTAAANLYYPEAESYFLQALSIAEAANPNDRTVREVDIRTRYLYSQYLIGAGRSLEAMEILQVGVEQSQSLNDLGKEIALLGTISTLWSKLENFEKAIQTQRHILKLRKKEDNLNGLAHSYQILGGTYYGMHKNDSAIYYTEAALEIFDKTQDVLGQASSHNNLAQMYGQTDELAKVEYHYQEAIGIYERMDDSNGFIRTKINLGLHQVRQGKITTGLKAIDNGTREAEALDNKMLRRLAYRAQYRGLAEIGRYEEAYEYRTRYHQLKDSMINEENLATIGELEKKYETERKEREIADLKETQASKELEILKVQQSSARRTLIIYILMGILLLGGLLTWLFIRLNRLRQRQKSMELQQRLLRSRMNPHFIFNALNSIQRLYQDGDQLRANDYVADLGQLLRGILDHSGEEKVSLADEISMLERYLRMEQNRLDDGFQYEISLDDSLDIYDILVPPLILQPLAENAIWHGILPKGGQGHILVKVWAESQTLYMQVVDDGIGLAEARRKRSLNHDPKALMILEERLGSGGSLSLAERHDEKGEVQGTEVQFSVPLVWREEN
ncbi:MAG: histidine kinase [Bacteroidia bacterium]